MNDRSVFFQKKLPLGATVQVKTKDGTEFHGIVLEHEGGFLLMQETNGGESFIDYNDISSVRKLENSSPSKESGNTSIIEPIQSELHDFALASVNGTK